jgi:transcriptional regulator with XRE-family HTH domain
MDADGRLGEAAGFAQVSEAWCGHNPSITKQGTTSKVFYNLRNGHGLGYTRVMTRGERIRMAMQVARIKQPQLAKLIGTSQVYVSRIVNDHDPADARLPKIAEVLSVPFEWLAVGGSPPEWASSPPVVESTETRDGGLRLPLIRPVTHARLRWPRLRRLQQLTRQRQRG